MFLVLGVQSWDQGVKLGAGKEGVELPRPRWPWGQGLPSETACEGLWASRSSGRKALAQIENSVWPVSGGGEEGPAVSRWQIFGSFFCQGLPSWPREY